MGKLEGDRAGKKVREVGDGGRGVGEAKAATAADQGK